MLVALVAKKFLPFLQLHILLINICLGWLLCQKAQIEFFVMINH